MSEDSKRPHGYSRYRLDGCRCYTCGFAVSEYEQNRQARIAEGTWQPFTGIEPARRHIAKLRGLGYGERSIALLAGVGRKVVRDIRTGIRHDPGRGNPPLVKIRTETSAAILAVPLDTFDLPDGVRIDAAQTWAWIDDLLTRGWTQAAIAEEAGLGRCLQLGRDTVTVRNHRRIEALHDRATRRGLDTEDVEGLIGSDTPESVARRLGYDSVKSLTRALYAQGQFALAGKLNGYAA